MKQSYCKFTVEKFPKRQFYTSCQAEGMQAIDVEDIAPTCNVLWCHGWGMDRHSFDAVASQMPPLIQHYFVDFAGFGSAQKPPRGWSVEDFAKDLASALREEIDCSLPVLLVGHSFGCTVALELEKWAPDLFDEVVMIAPPGIATGMRKVQRMYKKVLSVFFRSMRPYLSESWTNWWRRRIGSADYLASQGVMRESLVKVVSYDTAGSALLFSKRALLIGSDRDRITPASTIRELARVLPRGAFCQLSGYDHHSILTDGSHELAAQISEAIERMNSQK